MLPQLTENEIEEEIHLLELDGLVRLKKFAGGRWYLSLTARFYENVDPSVMGWSPADDARMVALHMLNNGTGRAAIIHEATGWERRRFNPAYRHIIDRLPASSISPERSPIYPAVSILWWPEVRAALIRFP
jgi:hypothetical protein